MARRYYRVGPSFWTDDAVLGWTDDAKLLALYLLTSPHRTGEGLFRLPKAYAMADLGWTPERFAEPFAELLRDGFIEYDEQASVCLLTKALKWQAPENANQVKAAVKALSELPATPLKARFHRLSEQYAERLHEGLPEGFGEGLPEGYGNPPSLSPIPKEESVDSSSSAVEDRDEQRIIGHPEADRLCQMLASLIRQRDPKAKVAPESKRWRDSMRLLITADGRDPGEVERIIRWCQQDGFWAPNILCPSKLREKFTQLAGKANQTHRPAPSLTVARGDAVLARMLNERKAS